MESAVNITTDKRKFFRQYLNILKPVLKPHLINGELNVLGELLYYNNKYKDIAQKERMKLIFDYDTKVDIVDNLSISPGTLSNIITSLRRKKYLTDKSISKSIIIHPDKEFAFKYIFNIKDEG